MSRRRWSVSLFGAAGLVVAGCVAGILAALALTQGPGEAAASRAAPSLPVPTAQVVVQELRDQTEVLCEYSGVVVEAIPPGSAGKFRARVVTSVDVKPDAELKSGMRVVSVSGRPVIAFVTGIDFYRDLGVGDSGVDVKELEKGLVAAGRLAKADSRFEADTAKALEAINKAAGLGGDGRFVVDSAWGVPAGTKVSEVLVQVGDKVAKDTALATGDTQAGLWSCELPAGVSVAAGDELGIIGGDGTATVEQVGGAAESEAEDEAAELGATFAKVRAAGIEPDGGLTVAVVSAATDGEVTTVPVGALFSSPAGGQEVRRADGTVVPVEVGVVAAGWAQVSGAGLAGGDVVQLGEFVP